MSVFIPLLLTHFIADYPLQSGLIIRLKQKNYWGVLVHCLIHLGVMVLVMQGFWQDWRIFLGVLIVFITHNIIDQAKVTLDKKHPKWRLTLYISDQLAHVFVVAGVAWWLGAIEPMGLFAPVYQDPLIMAYLLLLVLSTYFYDVTRYFLKHRMPDGSHYERDYRGIVMHAVGVSVVFGGAWVIRALMV